MFAGIVLADSTRAYDRPYTYAIPEGMVPQPGMRCLVPFGAKNELREGWVVTISATDTATNTTMAPLAHPATCAVVNAVAGPSDDVTAGSAGDAAADSADEAAAGSAGVAVNGSAGDPAAVAASWTPKGKKRHIKAIDRLVDETPPVPSDLLKVAGWMRERFFCTWHQALSAMLPSGARLIQKADGSFARRDAGKTRRAMMPNITREQFELMAADGSIRSLHHVHVLEVLLDEEICPVEDLYLLPGVSPNVLLTMKKKGWITETRLEATRDPFSSLSVERRPAPPATPEQEAAFARLAPLLTEKSVFSEALIFGVTGSGKTELYLRLIETALAQGKGAIMLVPEISLTPQTVERFLARFGSRVAVLHSRLSMGERYDQWRRIHKGELDVVVGARSAIFAPLARLGLVLIDEEHEGAYKSESSPRYDARLVARARCNIAGGLLVYGSATPSVETFHRAAQGKILRVDMKDRVAGRPLPEVRLIDMRAELTQGNRSHFSRALAQELTRNKMTGEQSILFLNRRGLAAFQLCRDCGLVLKCPQCSVSLVLHRKGRLVCHHCGHMEPAASHCPGCGSGRMESVGLGTQKLEEDLASHTDGYKVIRMDLDTTTGKEGHRHLLDAFRAGEADVLVGTQMVAKGHDFPNVTLVGILSADSMLATGDWRASERTFALLAQAAGRAGRAEKPGRVIVQAFNVDDYSLQSVLAHDYEGFFAQEIMMRQKLWLPPFCHVGLVMLTAETQKGVTAANQQVNAFLRTAVARVPGLMVAEGMPAPLPMLNGRYRYRALLRHVSVRVLQSQLSELLDACRKPLAALKADMTVDIDPGSVL